jgi:hypothetical protein
MIIAKRHPLMHRQLAREPGTAAHYAGKVSVVLVSLIALGATALSLDRAAPERAASSFAAETGSPASPAPRDLAEDPVARGSSELPAAGDHMPETVVDDVNARVIADL